MNRWRLKYTLGQIFAASRGTVLWVQPGNGYEYYLNYHNGKIGKEKIYSLLCLIKTSLRILFMEFQ